MSSLIYSRRPSRLSFLSYLCGVVKPSILKRVKKNDSSVSSQKEERCQRFCLAYILRNKICFRSNLCLRDPRLVYQVNGFSFPSVRLQHPKNQLQILTDPQYQADYLSILNHLSAHLRSICKSAANQLNALIRLQTFLCFKKKKISIKSYFMANFNYCL